MKGRCRIKDVVVIGPAVLAAFPSRIGTHARRRIFRGLVQVGMLLAAVISTAAESPNVLFILTEDQGLHLGHVDTAGVTTPHMDALARTGTFFRNASVAYPVCSASKAALMTSLHSHSNGLMGNTANFHKPAAALTPGERNREIYRRNRIRATVPTLIERLKAAGYYQGVTHKLHVAPNEKFPYDEFLRQPRGKSMAGFINRASQAGKPWFLLFNIPNPHRPFPNSDNVSIGVDPNAVRLPGFLPDTPVVRQDWAEYLAAIEEADELVGEALRALSDSGQEKNTIVVFMSDHGPCFQHGKMSLYEMGLRVPLVLRIPGYPAGDTESLASELDVMPTLLDLLGLDPLAQSHGFSLRDVLTRKPNASDVREFVFAEISDRGPLPNDGMQERSVSDGHWKLIYRENTDTAWRQVNADLKHFHPWRNRTYDETVRVRGEFPEAYRILREMDPQGLDGTVPALELYNLRTDPDELHNLIADPSQVAQRDRLYQALVLWAEETTDSSISPPPTAADVVLEATSAQN